MNDKAFLAIEAVIIAFTLYISYTSMKDGNMEAARSQFVAAIFIGVIAYQAVQIGSLEDRIEELKSA